jgi:hypothetical protein
LNLISPTKGSSSSSPLKTLATIKKTKEKCVEYGETKEREKKKKIRNKQQSSLFVESWETQNN